MPITPDLGDEALTYARNGFAVFPCQPRGKDPLTMHGFKDATSDEAEIQRRWRRCRDANIGLPTGETNGIMVVDIDGEKGERKWAKLTARFGEPPATSQVKTGRGRHLYFVLPEGCGEVKSSTNDGLDIRADGGYVVTPPSIHPNGERYAWDPESPDEFALAPEWLLDFARNPKAVLKALDGPAAAKAALGGLPGEGRPAPLQGRSAADQEAAGRFAPPPSAPEPWSEIGERRLRSALKAIPAFDRGTWLKVGFALHDLTAGDSRWQGGARWDEWSKTCPEKFNEADQQKTLASFERDYSGPRITVATIYHLAQEFGWRDPTAATAECHTSVSMAQSVASGANSDKAKVAGPEGLQEPHATFARLAALSAIEYDRVRIAEAEKLGVRVGTLDEQVSRCRPQDDDACAAGRALSLASPEPWPDPIDGAALLEAIVETITRYVALSPAAAQAHCGAFTPTPSRRSTSRPDWRSFRLRSAAARARFCG